MIAFYKPTLFLLTSGEPWAVLLTRLGVGWVAQPFLILRLSCR